MLVRCHSLATVAACCLTGDGGSALSSALPSAVSSVLDQHPEERAPTPPVLQLPFDRFFGAVNVRKQRLRAASKGPIAVEDTGRREQEDDQGPPAAATAAAAVAAAATAGLGSTCSSSQPTPVSGPGSLLSSSSAVDLTAPTPHGASILSGAAGSSLQGGSSGGDSSSSKAVEDGKQGAGQLEAELQGLTLRDIGPGQVATAGQPEQQQQQIPLLPEQPQHQQQRQEQRDTQQQTGSGEARQPQQQPQEPQVHQQQAPSLQAAPPPQQQQQQQQQGLQQQQPQGSQQQQPEQQQQQQQPSPAAPVFKFGLDPGSNMQEAAAAAAAATAAVFGVSQQQQKQQQLSSAGAAAAGVNSFDSDASSTHDPLAHTFRLRLADSIPRELQQLQQQQQQQPHLQQQQPSQQQQPQPQQQMMSGQQPVVSWRASHDPRYPPLLQGQTPPDTPDGAAAANAGGTRLTELQPEQHLGQQQQETAGGGHVWEQSSGVALHWRRGELLGELMGCLSILG